MDINFLSQRLDGVVNEIDQVMNFYKGLPQNESVKIDQIVNVLFNVVKEIHGYQKYIIPNLIEAQNIMVPTVTEGETIPVGNA